MPTTTIYLNNKYNTWYHNIIANAQNENRAKGNGEYYENHHIVPKSFGGSDEKSNLVLLTAREHFICHALLVRFTTGKNKSSMVYAFNMMYCTGKTHQRYINSRLYESNKIKMANLVSENNIGNTNNLGKKFTKEHKQKMSIARLGKKHSKETKQKMSIALSGRKFTKEHKQKISASAHKGKNNYQYKGDYHTPHGIFETLISAATDLISSVSIYRWCKNPDKIITEMMIRKSKYLKQLPESPLGKTFREIGFWFEFK